MQEELSLRSWRGGAANRGRETRRIEKDTIGNKKMSSVAEMSHQEQK